MAYTNIDKSSLHFNTKLYTGTGSTNAVTGVGFQPDFTWIKRRDTTSSNQLFDAVRGVTKRVFSDTNEAESTSATTLTSFDTDGFTVSTHTGLNASSGTYASWNWKANGQGSANTDGSINTTYTSANTTSGVSIIQYTGNSTSGATIGHGLGAVPKMFITKKTNTTDDWLVYHASLGNTKYLKLNTTISAGTATDAWNDTSPTSSVISLGSASTTNGSGATFIGYAFAEKKGFSKFGSYTGNGNADGTFIYTGFKPVWVMIKQSSSAGNNWWIIDNKRVGYNSQNNVLFSSLNNAEETSVANNIEILSNGFKLRATGSGINASGSTYIYIAFGQSLVGSNNVPCTAR